MLSLTTHVCKIDKLPSRIYGAELPAMSPSRLRLSQEIGASNDGVETCKLGARRRAKGLNFEILRPETYLWKKFKKKLKHKKNQARILSSPRIPFP